MEAQTGQNLPVRDVQCGRHQLDSIQEEEEDDNLEVEMDIELLPSQTTSIAPARTLSRAGNFSSGGPRTGSSMPMKNLGRARD